MARRSSPRTSRRSALARAQPRRAWCSRGGSRADDTPPTLARVAEVPTSPSPNRRLQARPFGPYERSSVGPAAPSYSGVARRERCGGRAHNLVPAALVGARRRGAVTPSASPVRLSHTRGVPVLPLRSVRAGCCTRTPSNAAASRRRARGRFRRGGATTIRRGVTGMRSKTSCASRQGRAWPSPNSPRSSRAASPPSSRRPSPR